MPILQSIYNELPREQFTIVSINGDDPSNSKRNAKVSSYIQRSKYTFPVALDNGSTMNRYQVRRIPTLMILDPKGTIRYVHTGVTSKSDLLDEINKLIPN